MMRHYIVAAKAAETVNAAPVSTPLTLVVSERLNEAAEELAPSDANADPATVGEFVKAITALSLKLAAANAKIAELEQSPPVNPDEVKAWEDDWLELNHLLAYYAVDRGWCSDFENYIREWNGTHFKRGYLLSRRELGAENTRYLDRNRRQTPEQQRENTMSHNTRAMAARRRFEGLR